jgi:hypothetical protein
MGQRHDRCIKPGKARGTNIIKTHFNSVLRVESVKSLTDIRPCLD